MRIPKFLSNLVAETHDKAAADKVRQAYKSWCDSPITKGFLKDLNTKVDKLVLKDEESVTSLFEFKSGIIKGRAQRRVLRDIAKDLTY